MRSIAKYDDTTMGAQKRREVQPISARVTLGQIGSVRSA